ncbi:insulin-like growth factor-binding protein 2 [Melanotaenia boesemani]|uniref:insulin-like growth factor-binding protein 2 n=1 Tax=Melanotaenia boesemani TaxID=1250792 RepID=UPI001C04A52F|nr:insulin-like growth factor-binding protein 2 [Melanotaenia boesemani]XP_041866477.1 insulin-like growth factor-binding protein 2 [Melanotaenia boesemani]
MAEPETQTLIGASNQQTVVDVGAPTQRARSSRAYKVAGVTLLAGVLIVSQVAIAYFLLSQRSDIKSLAEQNNKIKTELTKGRSGGGSSLPSRMHIPMQVLPEMLDNTVEEASTGTPEKSADPLTPCQMETTGLKPVQVPGFYPMCDKQGLYKAQQCYIEHCWCVNPQTGDQIPGSVRKGPVSCVTPVGMLTLTNVDA